MLATIVLQTRFLHIPFDFFMHSLDSDYHLIWVGMRKIVRKNWVDDLYADATSWVMEKKENMFQRPFYYTTLHIKSKPLFEKLFNKFLSVQAKMVNNNKLLFPNKLCFLYINSNRNNTNPQAHIHIFNEKFSRFPIRSN